MSHNNMDVIERILFCKQDVSTKINRRDSLDGYSIPLVWERSAVRLRFSAPQKEQNVQQSA